MASQSTALQNSFYFSFFCFPGEKVWEQSHTKNALSWEILISAPSTGGGENPQQLLLHSRWKHLHTLDGEVITTKNTLMLSWKAGDARVGEIALWGRRIESSPWLRTRTFRIPFLSVMPLCNRAGASYFQHIFSVICWGSFNLSLRFIGTGWLLQGSFWMECINCRLGLLPVASPWTCNPGLWVTTVKNQWRSLPFFLLPLLALKTHFSLPFFSFCFLSGKGRNEAQEFSSKQSSKSSTAGVSLRRLFFFFPPTSR